MKHLIYFILGLTIFVISLPVISLGFIWSLTKHGFKFGNDCFADLADKLADNLNSKDDN